MPRGTLLIDKLRAPLAMAVVTALLGFAQPYAHAATLSHVETVEEGRPAVGIDNNNPDRDLYSVSGTVISADGKYVYVTGRLDDALNVFSRDAQTGRLTLVQVVKQGVDGIDGLRSVEAIAVSPDSRYVYTIGLGANSNGLIINDTILGFERDEATGRLSQIERISDETLTSGLDTTNARMTLSPDGFFLYVSAFNDPNIAVFQKSANGKLEFKQALPGGLNGQDAIDEISYPFDVTVSPDGQNVYMVAQGTVTVSPTGDSLPRGSLVAFSRDTVDGTLTGLETYKNHVSGFTELAEPRAVVVSPDGNQVYVAASDSHSIAIFDRAVDGRLTYRKNIDYSAPQATFDNVLWSVSKLILSPNGRFLYAGTDVTSLFPVMLRDTTTGELTPIGYEGDGINTLEAGDAEQFAMSGDGRFLYIGVAGGVNGVITFDASADVSIVVKDAADNLPPGGTITYTATVSNEGPADANVVVATFELPQGVQYVGASVDVPGGSCTQAEDVVTCDVGKLVTGASAPITLKATAPAALAELLLEGNVTAAQVVRILPTMRTAKPPPSRKMPLSPARETTLQNRRQVAPPLATALPVMAAVEVAPCLACYHFLHQAFDAVDVELRRRHYYGGAVAADLAQVAILRGGPTSRVHSLNRPSFSGKLVYLNQLATAGFTALGIGNKQKFLI